MQGDTALVLSQKAWQLAKKNNLLFWQARARGSLAVSYRNMGGNSKKYVEHMQSALRIFKKINDKKWEAQVYIHLGVYYDYDGNYSESLKNYFQAEKSMVELKDTIGMVEVYGNIGIVYELLEDGPSPR